MSDKKLEAPIAGNYSIVERDNQIEAEKKFKVEVKKDDLYIESDNKQTPKFVDAGFINPVTGRFISDIFSINNGR